MAACPVALITFWRLTATGLPASPMSVCQIDGPRGLARASKQSGPKQSHFIHPTEKKIQTSNMQRPKRQECRLAHQMGARRPGRPTSGNAELLHAFAGPVPTSDILTATWGACQTECICDGHLGEEGFEHEQRDARYIPR